MFNKKSILCMVLAVSMVASSGCSKLGKGTTNAPQILQDMTVYFGDKNAEFIISRVEKVTSVDQDTILAKLKEKGVLGDDVLLNQVELKTEEGNQVLYLDFNEAFLQQLQSAGSAGERILMGSVVNTFLEGMKADQVVITVNGAAPETGDNVYDAPMEKYAPSDETEITKKINGKERYFLRTCTDLGFSFDYSDEKFKLDSNKKQKSINLTAKKDANAYMKLYTSEMMREEYVGNLMKNNKDGLYQQPTSESIGKGKSLPAIHVSAKKDAKGCKKDIYLINALEDTWIIEVSSDNAELSKYLKATLKSLEFVR